MTEGSCQPSAVSHQQSTSSTWRRRDGGETGTNAKAGPRARGSPPGARGVNEIAANYCEILLTGGRSSGLIGGYLWRPAADFGRLAGMNNSAAQGRALLGLIPGQPTPRLYDSVVE